MENTEAKGFELGAADYILLESIGISILGTRMNTDYQDINSYKKPNICGNL